MKNTIRTMLLIGCLLLFGCSKSDDGKTISAPNLSYFQNVVKTPFHKVGSSEPPIIDWNGNQGSFGLENSIESVSIDSKTGIVSWGKTLSLDTNIINVIAFNNKGSTATAIQLKNEILGKFEGSYDPFFEQVFTTLSIEFNFMDNGILNGHTRRTDLDGIVQSTTILEGTWSRTGNKIDGEFILKENGDKSEVIVLNAVIAYSETIAFIDGTYRTKIDDGIRPTNFHVDYSMSQ